MATTCLEFNLSRGLFTGIRGRHPLKFLKKKIVLNGWKCYFSDQIVVCEHCAHVAPGDIHLMFYSLRRDGFESLRLYTRGNCNIIYERLVSFEGEQLERGTIKLSDGPVDKRYAFSYSESNTSFLEAHGLTSVVYKDPNATYALKNATCARRKHSTEIYSDGVVKIRSSSYDKVWPHEELDNCTAYKRKDTVKVSHAKWVVVEMIHNEPFPSTCSRILITKVKNIRSLTSIPNLN